MRSSKTSLRSGLTVMALAGLAAVGAAGCRTATGFDSTWRNPESKPIQLNGQTVVALVISTQETTRRQGEDAIAAEITARGAKGVASWTILPTADMQNEEKTRAALTKAGFIVAGSCGVLVRGGQVAPDRDHRIAMAGAVLGLLAEEETLVPSEDIATSFPTFADLLRSLGAEIE